MSFIPVLAAADPSDTKPDTAGPSLVTRFGVLGIGDEESVDPVGALEVRFPTRWHGLQPWFGLNLTDGGTWWGGAGIVYHHDFTPHWRATIGSGPFYYQGGPERDLGFDLEFYSFLEVTRRLRRHDSIGVRVGHLSNAGLSRRNPGSETFSIVYSRPLVSLTRWWRDDPVALVAVLPYHLRTGAWR
jgi:hypothetical protein